MALSDELTKLAARAKEAETRTAAARDEAHAQLERDVAEARTKAITRATAAASKPSCDGEALSAIKREAYARTRRSQASSGGVRLPTS